MLQYNYQALLTGGNEAVKKTLGMIIAELRKEKGMTQLELAEKMRVTDKAILNGKEIYLAQTLIHCQI